MDRHIRYGHFQLRWFYIFFLQGGSLILDRFWAYLTEISKVPYEKFSKINLYLLNMLWQKFHIRFVWLPDSNTYVYKLSFIVHHTHILCLFCVPLEVLRYLGLKSFWKSSQEANTNQFPLYLYSVNHWLYPIYSVFTRDYNRRIEE